MLGSNLFYELLLHANDEHDLSYIFNMLLITTFHPAVQTVPVFRL